MVGDIIGITESLLQHVHFSSHNHPPIPHLIHLKIMGALLGRSDDVGGKSMLDGSRGTGTGKWSISM